MKLFIYDEGWAGGFAVIAENKSQAADIIIQNEDIPPDNPEAYKLEILTKLQEMPAAIGAVYHFYGDR